MRAVWLICVALALGGCTTLAYYGQAVDGQLRVMAASQPIEDLIADKTVAPALREHLVQVPGLRRFAADELGLVSSDSYRLYADLQREAMVWSLVATPEDSLKPRTWCYPVIGCAAYRGYFRKADAEAHAARLADEFWDVAVVPVPAYSTLGWFSDPVPSTIMHWPIADIAGLIFHELAHETLYIDGDSAFNEAYATVVEHEGVRRWLQRYGDATQRLARRQQDMRRAEFVALLRQTHHRLAALYGDGLPREKVLVGKREAFAALKSDYSVLKESWGDYAGYDRWFDRPLNNAHLASVAIYHGVEPALRRLLQQLDGDLSAFHDACREIASLPQSARDTYLAVLMRDDLAE